MVEEDVIPLEFSIPGTDIREIRVKPGLIIDIPVRDGVNVDERVWSRHATKFRPERWIDPDGLQETLKLIRAQGHLLTFGEGLVSIILSMKVRN